MVAFSGGKDSLACLLHLIEMGVAPGKIHLLHHEIDGREGSTHAEYLVRHGFMDFSRKPGEKAMACNVQASLRKETAFRYQ